MYHDARSKKNIEYVNTVLFVYKKIDLFVLKEFTIITLHILWQLTERCFVIAQAQVKAIFKRSSVRRLRYLNLIAFL